MRALILAAGRGSRMGELTDAQPKSFTRLHGVRLLDLQLAALREAGIRDIAIVRGYRANSFTEPVSYFENPHWMRTNMVRSLQAAHRWLAAEPCIVSYSDIFYSAQTVSALIGCNHELAISYDPAWLDLWARRFADPLSDAETFRLAPNRDVTEIGGRPPDPAEVHGQFMGLLRICPGAWTDITGLCDALANEADRLDMTGLLRMGIAAGWQVGAVPVVGAWGEVDREEDLRAYAPSTRGRA
jgi:choline kinase